ncbi:MAG: T9SS type A sorting domain-containing protein [Taibaiella sp.]|nr:T9SS type A sorting domain-containing protein [Taibaiella sp.]
MKIKHYLFRAAKVLLLGTAFLSQNVNAQIIQINTGSPASDLYAVGPIYISTTMFYTHSRFAYLYTQAELATAGITSGTTITALGWMKGGSSSSAGPSTFRIYMKNSSATAYAASSETWSNLSAGATLVYQNTSQSFPATASPNYIPFTLNTPFVYSGGAIEIMTEWDASATPTPLATGSFEWVNTTVTDRIYGAANTSAPASLSSTSNNTSIDNRRPVIQFTLNGVSGCTNPVTPGTSTASVTAPVCPNTSVNLNLNGNSTGAGITYEWERSATNTAGSYTSMGASQTSPAASAQPATSTWYRCKVVCSGGTAAYSTPVQVQVANVSVNLGNDTTICEGRSPLVLNAGNTGGTYLWNDGATGQTKSVSAAGTYWVQVTNATGCQGRDTIVVGFNPLATGTFSATEVTGGMVNFAATASNASSYFWQFGVNNATATGNPASYTYGSNGNYTVTLNLINACGDTTKVTKPVTVTSAGVGVKDILNDAEVSLFPNPAKEVLMLENASGLVFEQIRMTDVAGKVIYTAKGKGTQKDYTFNIRHLDAGIYYLEISTPSGRIVKQFSIK